MGPYRGTTFEAMLIIDAGWFLLWFLGPLKIFREALWAIRGK